ncbi:hypothetical protein N7536_004973 [Penicillium majusculum]|nr:hypothetical protein N7536_004973 [Penicillium majusculum]
MADSEHPPTICTYCHLPGHNLANCHVLAGLAVMNRISVTRTIEKKTARRRSRGGKAKRANKAKEAKEAKEGKEVSRGTQSDLDTAHGTSASDTGPRLTFIGEVLTEREAEFLMLCLLQFRASREPHKEGEPGQQPQQELGVIFHVSDEERHWGRWCEEK